MSIELKINKLWNERGTPCQGESWFKEGARAMAKELCCEAPKIVDLSIVAGSNIPMCFSNMAFKHGDNIHGFLANIVSKAREDKIYKESVDGPGFKHCRFDTSRPVAWFGGDCPLPEGVEAKIWFRRGTWQQAKSVGTAAWTRRVSDRDMDIIAFQVTGLAPGYKYSWE